MTEPFGDDRLTSRAVGVSVIEGVLDPGLVDVDTRLSTQLGKRLDKRLALVGVLLAVAIAFFLRV